jgi:DNA-binding MarR family transcriptional regulator
MSNTNNTFDKNAIVINLNAIQKRNAQSFVIQKTAEKSIISSLLNLTDAMTKKAEIHFQRYGITVLQYRTLLYLAGDPNIDYIVENRSNSPMVASELAEALNVSRPNITNLLNLLIEKKLVTQEKDKNDWRKKPLVLTEHGWALIEKLEPTRHRMNKRLLAHLGDEEKACFLEALRTCLDLLNETEEP